MRSETKALVLHMIGLAICIVPAAVATLVYFPLWLKTGDGESVISMFSVFMLLICAIPFRKSLVKALKSPSAWQVWLVSLIVFVAVRCIVDEMIAISYVALPASLIGALFFKWEQRYKRRVTYDNGD